MRPPFDIGRTVRTFGRLVSLHERERWTRHLLGVANKGVNEAAREYRLAGAEIAPQRQNVAGLGNGGQLSSECTGVVLAARGQLNAVVARCRRGCGNTSRPASRLIA